MTRRIKQEHDGMFPHLTSQQLFLFCEVLEESHKFAKSFNCDNDVRTALWKAGKFLPLFVVNAVHLLFVWVLNMMVCD